jgi:hypothetical protein
VEARTCANCGAHAPGRFCPECGQETTLGPAGLLPAARTLFARTLGKAGVFTLTFLELLTKPGGLTLEFLRGRRVRYLRPLQLYLLVSVLVFSGVQLFDRDLVLRVAGEHGLPVLRSQPPSVEAIPAGAWTPLRIVTTHLDTPAVRRFAAMPDAEKFAFLHARRARYVSSMLLLLVPALAATLAAAFLGRHQPFLTHLVFAVHAQAFLLLGLLVQGFLPSAAANALSWWMIAYVYVALRRVYGCGWGELLLRGTASLAGYLAAFYAANLLLLFGMMST